MPRYRVTIPMTVELVYEIDCEDEDTATSAEVSVHEAADGSIFTTVSAAIERDAVRLTIEWPDSADFGSLEVEGVTDGR